MCNGIHWYNISLTYRRRLRCYVKGLQDSTINFRCRKVCATSPSKTNFLCVSTTYHSFVNYSAYGLFLYWMLKLSNLCTFLICDQGHCYFPPKFAVGNHLYFYCSPYLAENYFQVINNSTRSGLDTSQNMDLYFHLLTFSGGTRLSSGMCINLYLQKIYQVQLASSTKRDYLALGRLIFVNISFYSR